ncbi:MAG: pseudouridine synthase [Christensenellales bacterium]
MRLQKYLALCGVASRRHAEQMILEGSVQVNGVTVREMGIQVGDEDEVRVHGEVIRPEAEKHYVLYYKPVGEVSSVSDPQGRPTVLDRFRDFPVRLYPVGRLDFDSEGLLLLTNDGELTARLTHPSYEVDKSYIARVSLTLDKEELHRLHAGVMIDGQMTAKAKVRILRQDAFSTDILITIHEGRNRQIRRMVEAIGHQTIRLKRVKYGPIELGQMERGSFRELTSEEVTALREDAQRPREPDDAQ